VVALMDAPLEPGWVVVDDGDGLGGPGRPVGWVLGPGLTSTVLLEDPAARESGTSCAVGDGGVEIVDEMFLYRCDRGRGVVLDHGVDVVRGVRGGQSTGGLVSEIHIRSVGSAGCGSRLPGTAVAIQPPVRSSPGWRQSRPLSVGRARLRNECEGCPSFVKRFLGLLEWSSSTLLRVGFVHPRHLVL
jgi:hypothetical protein